MNTLKSARLNFYLDLHSTVNTYQSFKYFLLIYMHLSMKNEIQTWKVNQRKKPSWICFFIQIQAKIEWFLPWPIPHQSTTSQQNWFSTFCIILLRDKRTNSSENITFLAPEMRLQPDCECRESDPYFFPSPSMLLGTDTILPILSLYLILT